MRDVTPEQIAEQFIAAAIDRAPEPLQRLGRLLTELLDAEDFNAVEPLLLGLAEDLTSWQAMAEQLAQALEEYADRDLYEKAVGDQVFWLGSVDGWGLARAALARYNAARGTAEEAADAP